MNDFNRKMKDFTPLTKLAKMWAIWVKFIVATGFKKLPKVQ